MLSTTVNAGGKDAIIVKVSDPQVQGKLLKPFDAKWRQYHRDKSGRRESGYYHEQLIRQPEAGQWKHIQSVTQGNNVRVTTTTVFDEQSLNPVSLVQQVNKKANAATSVSRYRFEQTSYEEQIDQPGNAPVTNTVHLPTAMFNTSNFGLVLASLSLDMGKIFRLPLMYPQYEASMYWVTARVTGTRDFRDHANQPVPAWQVDIEWLDLKGGGIYPGGPDKSGGSYFILKQPHDSLPPVLAYLNDSTAIEVDTSTGPE